MRAKRLVNAGLAKAGYAIVRRDRVAALASRQVAPPPPPPRPRGRPGHVDAAAQRTIEAVRPRTMTSEHKLFALIVATRYVVDHGIPGAIVECGVWRGGSMQAVALHAAGRGGVTDRDLHLFDTFEGMTEPTEQGRRHDGTARGRAARAQRPDDEACGRSRASTTSGPGWRETGYPAERVHFDPGPVEDTIPGAAPGRIALLRLDTDWYESTRHELEHLYDRVASGGVLIIDDYGFWQGARHGGRRVPRPHGCAAAAGPDGVRPDRGQALSGT